MALLECDDKEVSVVFLDDDGIQKINQQYLKRDRPTNVIAFSMQEGEFGEVNPSILGDIIISVETAQRDALEGDMPLEHMIDYLMIHGILHLTGYDHEGDITEAKKMKEKEIELFNRMHGYSIEERE